MYVYFSTIIVEESNVHTNTASQGIEQQILIARRVCEFLILCSILCGAKLVVSAFLFHLKKHRVMWCGYC